MLARLFVTAVLCSYMLDLASAAFLPHEELVAIGKRQNASEDLIGPFPEHLRTFGLPLRPDLATTMTDQPLPTTFTVAHVQSDTTLYEVQTTTLYPFNRISPSNATPTSISISLATVTTSRPTPTLATGLPGIQALGPKKGDSRRPMKTFRIVGGITFGLIGFASLVALTMALRSRRVVRVSDREKNTGSTSMGNIRVTQTVEKACSFAVVDGKVWLGKDEGPSWENGDKYEQVRGSKSEPAL